MSAQEDVRVERPETPQDRLSAGVIALGRPFGFALLLVAAFSFYEVVMRYVFNAPTEWVHETTTAMTAICFAFGGVYCVATDRHIRVVLIYDALGSRARRVLDVLISLVGMVATGLMAWAAWGLAYKGFYRPSGEFRLETTGTAWNPPTPAIVKSFLFLMLCVMCAQFALQTIRHVRRAPSAETRDPIEGRTGDA